MPSGNQSGETFFGKARELAKKPVARGAVFAAGAMLSLTACDNDASAAPSPTTNVEQTISAEPTQETVAPTPEAKSYEQVIEDIDPADFVIYIEDPGNLDPQEIAQSLLDRETKIEDFFLSPTAVEMAHDWYKDQFNNGDTAADMDVFRREQCQKVVDKLRDVYYASVVDTAADTRSIDEIGYSCYASYSNETAAIAEGINFTKTVTLEDGATITVLEDGSFISEFIGDTDSNLNEIDSNFSGERSRKYTVHGVVEDGKLGVISTSVEDLLD